MEQLNVVLMLVAGAILLLAVWWKNSSLLKRKKASSIIEKINHRRELRHQLVLLYDGDDAEAIYAAKLEANHLNVSSTSSEALAAAIARIKKIKKQSWREEQDAA